MARILVADDRPVNRQLLVTLLRQHDHEVIEAADGSETLEFAARERPDLLVLDYLFPDIDGGEVIQRIRKNPSLAATPIILYTAMNEHEARGQAAGLGVSAVIPKPSEPETILAAVSEALGERRERAAATKDSIHVADLERLTLRMSSLIELGLEMAASWIATDVVEEFALRCGQLLHASAAALALHRQGAWRLFRFARGRGVWSDIDISEMPCPRSDQPLMVYDNAEDLSRAWCGEEAGRAMIVSLETAHERHGFACFARSGDGQPFDEDDQRLGLTAAAQLALSYENTLLHEILDEHLRESSEEIAAIYQSAPTAIIIVNTQGVVEEWNRAAERMFGWRSDEVIGQPLPVIPPGREAEVVRLRESVMQGEIVSGLETVRRCHDGSLIDVAISAAPLHDQDGNVRGRITVFADISTMKRAEKDLASRAEQLSALSSRLVRAQEDERTRIAREIHDELGQLLTAAKLELSSLPQSVDAPESNARVQRVVALLDSTVQSVRRIAHELRPPVLDQLGLASAIESEVSAFEERTGIECEISIRPPEIELDRDRSTAIFRIVQEALTNVARHADATRVEIRLRQWPSEVLLDLRDNGRGITPEQLEGSRPLGLIGMRERARQFGGTIAIEGVSGRGTIFTVRIPVQKAAAP